MLFIGPWYACAHVDFYWETLYKYLFYFSYEDFTAQVLKVCRIPDPTAC